MPSRTRTDSIRMMFATILIYSIYFLTSPEDKNDGKMVLGIYLAI